MKDLFRLLSNPVVLSSAASFGFASLGLVFAISALIRQRGMGGLLAMSLASLAAGAGVGAQLLSERTIAPYLASLALPGQTGSGCVIYTTPASSPATIERARQRSFVGAQALGRQGAFAAVLPLLLGAIAALRRPVGSRALAVAFLGLGVLVLAGALIISHRGPRLEGPGAAVLGGNRGS